MKDADSTPCAHINTARPASDPDTLRYNDTLRDVYHLEALAEEMNLLTKSRVHREFE